MMKSHEKSSTHASVLRQIPAISPKFFPDQFFSQIQCSRNRLSVLLLLFVIPSYAFIVSVTKPHDDNTTPPYVSPLVSW